MKNPVIKEAYCKLQVMSNDEANRMIYEARLKAQRDEYSRLQGAIREGEKKGREAGEKEGRTEGRKEGLKQAARTLKSLGIPVETIVRSTALSPDEIAAL
jgi:predicted transposase/invertase (TIGR01784 family)